MGTLYNVVAGFRGDGVPSPFLEQLVIIAVFSLTRGRSCRSAALTMRSDGGIVRYGQRVGKLTGCLSAVSVNQESCKFIAGAQLWQLLEGASGVIPSLVCSKKSTKRCDFELHGFHLGKYETRRAINGQTSHQKKGLSFYFMRKKKTNHSPWAHLTVMGNQLMSDAGAHRPNGLFDWLLCIHFGPSHGFNWTTLAEKTTLLAYQSVVFF